MARLTSLPRRFIALILVLLGLGLAVPAVIVAQDVLTMDNEEQKDWLTSFVQDRLSTPERQIRLSNIEGALGSDVAIRQITISDAEGVWLRVNNARLNWNQAALFTGRLEVRSLTADSIEYIRNAVPVEGAVDLPAPEAGGFQVPELPVAVIIDELTVPSVTFGENVFGLGSEISLAGAMTLDGGNLDANLDIVRLDGPGGTLDLDVKYAKADASIDLGLALVEPENGVIANLLNIENRPAVTLTVNGSGPVTDLRTELSLVANGQTALSGVATVNQQAEGIAVAADLRGPLATLIAEPYRPFFGAETALTANALIHSAGGISVTGLRLSGGQLSLEAAAETTPDNFLKLLDLNAVIADPAGGQVILPVPGSATRIGSAQLAVTFGGGASEDWTATLAMAGFETSGFAAENLALSVGGVAANLSDPTTRRVTFNGDGTLSGISGSAEIEAALGDGIGLGIAGLWNAGEPVQLAEFRVAGQALTAALTGQLDGLDFLGDIVLETSSIAPFSGLAGRALNGALSLKANGSIMPLSGGFDLVLDGTGTNLAMDDELADGLLAGTVDLSGRVARTEAGLTAENFRIANDQVQMLADGTYSNALADFAFNLDLSDLGLLSDQASGALKVVGTAKGQDSVIDLDLDATVPSGTLAGRALRDAALSFDGRYDTNGLGGNISGAAALDGYRTTLAAAVSVTPETQRLADLDFQAAGTRITGGLTRTAETGLIDGGLTIVSPDVSVPAALALLDATGAINAEVTLASVDGRQGATIRGDVRALVVSDIRVGAADMRATVGDLFGVPAVDGAVNASGVSAAGFDVATLSLAARQSGANTAFEIQAGGIGGAAINDFGIAPLGVTANGTYRDGVVTLAALTANGSGGLTLRGSGTVPLEGRGLDIAVTGSAPLVLGNRFVADRGGQLSGVVTLDAQVRGSLASPQFDGRVSTSNAGYIDPELNLRLQGIAGSASLNGTNLVIDSLSANLATGGSVSASGSVGLNGGFPANVRVALNSARYADGNLFVATVSGSLALTGNLTGTPLLAGDVFVEEANITIPENFGGGAQLIDVDHVRTPPAVEQTLQRAKIDDRSGAPIPQTRPAGLLLDVNVSAPNQIFIRGRGLDAEVGGSVRLTGPINNIQPVGGFALNRGRLAILGQRVTFESGTVTLVGDLDPFLNLVARTEGEGITVFVTVSGRASDIDVSFSSSPMLPQDEVLSRLIFNRSMGELSPLQLAKLAGAAAELVGGGGNGLVDSLRGAAGLADLDIVSDDSGNVAVQAGTYIQDNVYLGVQAGANGQSKVTINLDVTSDLKVTGAAGQDGNSSLGVFYERDY
ncbi:translocation/assembly module TamB domain-containing protein [Devosia sp. Root635]|uniref:translocation/assembly module TamB domain-containing protein n=1 Tax=Devosia sp. Root635 TaxID=1736575 RepID=UPI0006FD903C|nr:translocation/assembly module TamB domain-containing protein [Devosia sp. Root635]KRA50445.1 hypothetical protein ASD80_15650 [Devosia sp. Root635]